MHNLHIYILSLLLFNASETCISIKRFNDVKIPVKLKKWCISKDGISEGFSAKGEGWVNFSLHLPDTNNFEVNLHNYAFDAAKERLKCSDILILRTSDYYMYYCEDDPLDETMGWINASFSCKCK